MRSKRCATSSSGIPKRSTSSSARRTRSCAGKRASPIANRCTRWCATTACNYNVQLIDKYLDFDEVVSYLAATDIYLTPYLNPAQIVSGTLAYAVGCGKAIVSTPYLYAQELLAHNRGFLCEFPRRGLDREPAEHAARRSARCVVPPSGARTVSAGR